MTCTITTIDCEYVRPELAAAFLRVQGDEAAFIETNTSHAAPRLLAALADAGLHPEQVRWVIVTHVHLDHAGGASALMKALPNATLLAHPRAARHLIDPSRLVASATKVYGAEHFAQLYGTIDPINAARVRSMDDGSTVDLGGNKLQFIHTRGHANHHFIVVDPSSSSVFTGDTFGLVYPRLQRAGRFAFPSTSPTEYDGAEARSSIQKILELGMERAFLTHFGEVTDLQETGAQLLRWIDYSDELIHPDNAENLARLAAHDSITLEEAIRKKLTARMQEEATRISLALTQEDNDLLNLDLNLNAQGLHVRLLAATK